MNECLNNIHGRCRASIKNGFYFEGLSTSPITFLYQGHILPYPPSQVLLLLLREQKHSSIVGKCVLAPGLATMREMALAGYTNHGLFMRTLSSYTGQTRLCLGFPSVIPMQGFLWTLAVPLILRSRNLCRSPASPSSPCNQKGHGLQQGYSPVVRPEA